MSGNLSRTRWEAGHKPSLWASRGTCRARSTVPNRRPCLPWSRRDHVVRRRLAGPRSQGPRSCRVLPTRLHEASPTRCCRPVETGHFFNPPGTPTWVTQPRAHACRASASPRSPSNKQRGQLRTVRAGLPSAPHSPVPSPHPGHLSDCSRAPLAQDPARAGAGPAAAADSCGKAVQTQQPCSVRASLSADICSGLASDGGGAHGPGDSQLARL